MTQMSDSRAALFAELIAEYTRESIEQGETLETIGNWTLRDTASDLQQTHPSYLPPLPAEIGELCKLA